MDYIIVKYLHLLGILTLFSCVVVEHLLVKEQMSPAEIRRVSVVDSVYGLSAGVVLAAGLVLWFVVGKGPSFYTANPIFHLKVSLFVVMGLLSIYPTLFFIKQRRATAASVTVPKWIKQMLRAQLAIALLLPLLAVLMAQGYGLR